MSPPQATLRVNAKRLRADFEALSAIGITPEGGVHRPALSTAHLAARAWFRERTDAAGLELCVDGAGNQSARRPSTISGAKTLLLGSHLDSVPNPGWGRVWPWRCTIPPHFADGWVYWRGSTWHSDLPVPTGSGFH